MSRKKAVVLAFFFLLAGAVALNGCSFPPFQRSLPAGEEPVISVYMHETGETKEMKLEEYLLGVVAGEMENDWPPAALGAQAIIARTFTVRELEEGGTREERGTDVSTDHEEFQAYNAENVNDRVRQAVEETRGLVITHQAAPVRAWFHACSGGHTATPREGLGFEQEPVPYLKAKEDPECEEKQTWEAEFSADEVVKAVRDVGPTIEGVEGIEVESRGPSGRATVIQINDLATVMADEFRLAIGSERMRSTWLTHLDAAGETVEMAGRGFGHGVGLSQFGARAMAKEGRSTEEIVRFYYDGVELERAWE